MPFDEVKHPGPQRGTHERAINLPPVILWLILVNVAIQLLREVLSDSVDDQIILEFGLIPASYTGEPGGDIALVGCGATVTGHVKAGERFPADED